MSNRSKLYVTVLALAMIAVAVIVWPREPRYEGKSLTYWLERQIATPVDFTRALQTQAALQEMGTNAIPWLLQKLQYRESALKQKIVKWAASHPTFPLKFTSQYEVNWQGATGFIMLGDRAVSAIPALKQLMQSDDEILAYWAMSAGSNMGSNSIPILIHGLTNQHAIVRSEAATKLSYLVPLADVESGKRAIPALLALLNDPDENARMNATNALLIIDPTVAAKAGIKRR